MKKLNEDGLRWNIINFIATRYGQNPAELEGVNDSWNLFMDGGLESMGMIDLIMHIEAETGIEIDFSGLNPEDFGTISGFIRGVLRHIE